jgi:hypothetical protein
MNKILLSMAALGAIAAAAPAAAQSNWNNGNNGNNWNADSGVGISSRIAQLDARVQAGVRSGEINRSEARDLRAQLRDLTRLEGRYSYNGFTQAERQDLRQRLRSVREQIRLADNGRYDRDNRYGNWEEDDYDRYGRGQGGYSGQGGYAGQGGPYEQPYDNYCDTNNRGGIGGLINGILGRDTNNNNNCTLRVGSRVTSGLYAVPSQYRYQFRDGNGVYYRSDGRNIYQIDARTQTVLRVYAMDR